jgi:thymidylate synthase ThyX
VPTLLKYAEPSAHLRETPGAIASLAEEALAEPPLDDDWDVQLVHFDPDAEERVVAALLYPQTCTSYAQVLRRVRAMSPEERARILDEAASRREKHEQVTRAWETSSCTFDILIDYGAFRDLQRHRMATQIHQPLSASHGFLTPPEIEAGGLAGDFAALMAQAHEAHDALFADLPEEAAYVVPLAFRKRTLFTMNLRELHHLIQLRSGPGGHVSYRRLANRLLEELRRVHPTLAAQVRCTAV